MNSDSTFSKVLAACRSLSHTDVKQQGKSYNMNAPYRSTADSGSFTLTEGEDGEHGMFIDRSHSESGSLYDLAKLLDVELPHKEFTSTKRVYTSLKDYAAAHGAPVEVFIAAGWEEVDEKGAPITHFCSKQHKLRPAFKYWTPGDVYRWRYTDGLKPPYASPVGYKRGWYGLMEAVDQITKDKAFNAVTGAPETLDIQPLVICNGEASVIVAQHWGMAACCVPGGEQPTLPDDLLEQLKLAYDGKILIALDCDPAGQKNAPKLKAQLEAAGYSVRAIDFGEAGGYDLADHCRLTTDGCIESLQEMKDLPGAVQPQMDLQTRPAAPGKPLAPPPPEKDTYSSSEVAEDSRHFFDPKRVARPPIILPWKNLRALGGAARYIPPGTMVAIGAASGNAKTSMMETVIDFERLNGVSGIGWWPEFMRVIYMERAIQRQGGLTFDQRSQHEIWLYEEQQGIPHTADARQATAEEQAMNDYLIDKIESWPGTFHTIDRMKMSMTRIIEEMQNAIDERKRVNPRNPIRYALVDYIQLVKLEKGEDIAGIVLDFKQFCVTNDIVGFVTSQLRKDDSTYAESGEAPGQDALLYLRSDYFNLVIIAARAIDANGNRSLTAQLYVPKNSYKKPSKTTIVQDPITNIWLDSMSVNTDTGLITPKYEVQQLPETVAKPPPKRLIKPPQPTLLVPNGHTEPQRDALSAPPVETSGDIPFD